jgi:hypothetical protein
MNEGMTRLFGAVLVAVASLFPFATQPAYAAKLNAMSESRALELINDHRLANAADDLQAMALALNPGPERDTLFELISIGTNVRSAVSSFLELAVIHQRMVNAKDKTEVSLIADVELKNARLVLLGAVASANRYLTTLKTPGAVAETQRLRDHMQELREELDSYRY